MGGLYSIGAGALNNAQIQVTTAGHNIANANTPGYSRQEANQTTNTPSFSGVGFIGQGASVSNITRVYDAFLGQQVRQANSQASEASTYLDRMQHVDSMVGDPSAGLTPALMDFFQGMQAVAASPADMSARQSLLSSAQSLASRFHSLDTQLSDLRSQTNLDIQASVTSINTLAGQIAALNDSIALSSASAGTGQQPNDLLDQRDTLVAELNKEIRADVVAGSNGTYSLFLTNGQALVLGTQAYTLGTVADAENIRDTQVTISVGATQMRLRPQDLSGGKLGGLMAFRQGGLTDAQNALGRIAIAVAESVNAQHQLGMDLNGDLGGDFFTAGGSSVSVVANAGNNATVNTQVSATIADYTALEPSDYRLVYDGTDYILTRLSDGTATNLGAALPATVDGMTITLDSVDAPATEPATGDQFLLSPNRSGATNFAVVLSDLRTVAAAAPIRTATGAGNTGSGAVSAGTVNPLPLNADLQNTVTITFVDATHFDVVDAVNGALAANVLYTSGSDVTYNGWTMQISGQPAAGDIFTVSANGNGWGDNRNARLMAALQTQTLINGSASYSTAYAQLVSQVGNKTHELQVSSESQSNLATAANNAQSTLSGVNLDEEASNLMRYQQAYQAAAKIVSIAGVLFDTILNIDR